MPEDADGGVTAFDRAYYRRFYGDPATAVNSRAEVRRRAGLIGAALRHLDLRVRRILDVGCGVGALRAPLLREFPGAGWLGVEISEYACGKFGWQRGSLQDLRVRGRFDLVVCYDVLQYVDDRAARRGMRNLARICRGALYFGALTREDWKDNCLRACTDPTPWMRAAAWYRRELLRAFVPVGLGLWVRQGTPAALWELDRA